METSSFEVGGMSCGGCVDKLTKALESIDGVKNLEIKVGKAVISHEGVARVTLSRAIGSVGFTVPDFDWRDGAVWKQSANNTKWCLLGCSIGEFATLAYYQYAGWPMEVAIGTTLFWFLAALPIINGLITSVVLETYLLMRTQMDLGIAFKTAMGMSFIGMIAMEAAMEATDWALTGTMGMNWWVIPPMLIAGFLTPWPYNYWRLKKYGKACH
jgi:copper chaperone CopZ